MRRLLPYLKKYKLYLLLAFFSAMINVVLGLIAPVLVGDAIDKIVDIGKVEFDAILQILVTLVLAIIGAAIFNWIMSNCTNKITYCVISDVRKDIFEKYNSCKVSFIDSNSHGDLISRIVNDAFEIGDGLFHTITQLFSGVVTIIGTLTFMVVINYKIAIVVVLVTPLSLFVAAFITKFSKKTFNKQQQLQGQITGIAEEFIGNQELVKTFNYEHKAQTKFDGTNSELYTVGQKAQFVGSLANPTTRFVNNIVYTSVGVIGSLGAIGIIGSTLSVGQISCFLSYANQYTKPFNEITAVLSQLQTMMASLRRIFEIIDNVPDEANQSADKSITNCKGNVEFRNVTFSYVPEKPLIQDLSFSVKSGQKIAIVGQTGCGKTTLINLLMRFYNVTSGEILLDGVNINDLNLDTYRTQYGMVLQDSWLFSGTIMENLRYGNEGTSDDEIIKTAKLCYAHDFISKLPDGYDTMITQDMANISQGQKQLLCIARVMLKNPSVLILDEATSSIDTLTEKRVQSAFDKLVAGRTSFVIAHRLSTIINADKILVMDKGNVVEQGTHDELLAKKGYYYELYNS